MNSTIARFGIAAAVVLVAAFVGLQLLPRTEPGGPPGPGTLPSTPAPTPGRSPTNILDVPDNSAPLEPGSYYIEPENIPVRVVYTVPAEGWLASIGALKDEQTPGREYRHVRMGILNVTNLVRHGCTDHRAADPQVGPTVDDLANALARLQPFVVISPPTDVTIDGYTGKYLELAVPEMSSNIGRFPDCTGGKLRSWMGEVIPEGFWGYTEPGQREEFWILDVEGGRLVIEAGWSPDSPSEDIAELREMLDSVDIQP